MQGYHSCPICHNHQNNYIQDECLQIFVCSVCTHVFSENHVAADNIYNQEYFLSEHKNWFLHPNLKLFGDIELYIKNSFVAKDLNILDVGCGRGDLLRFLRERQPAWHPYGIDVSENREQDIVYMHGDFVDHEFNQEFDVVMGLMVIEHVSDPVVFVKKIAAVLSDSGRVFLVTINSNSIIYRLAGVLRRLGWRAPFDRLYHHHHLQHFNNVSLRHLLEHNGFTVIRQYNHNFPFSAVDVPSGSALLAAIYKYVTAVLFCVTNIFGGGVNQTIICKKNI